MDGPCRSSGPDCGMHSSREEAEALHPGGPLRPASRRAPVGPSQRSDHTEDRPAGQRGFVTAQTALSHFLWDTWPPGGSDLKLRFAPVFTLKNVTIVLKNGLLGKE